MAGMPRAGPAGRRCALVGGVSAVLRETGRRRRRTGWTRTTASSWPRTCGAHPDWIGREFWALFRVEGMGADYQLVERTGPAWDAAVWRCARKSRRSRGAAAGRVEEALLRDFSAKSIAWYLRMHRLADPAAHGSSPASTRIAVLATAPSTAVGLAQDMLKRAVGLLDADAMIDAGAAVPRAEKKLVKAQLGLFAALRTDAGRKPPFADRRRGAGRHAAEPRALARKLDSSDETQRAATDGEMGAREEGCGQAVTIPPPRREPLPDLPDHTLAIVDDEALHA